MVKRIFGIEVLLPLYLKTLTYSVPWDMKDFVKAGIRVIIPLGNRKMYSGIVVGISENVDVDFEIKDIIGIIDETPIVTASQLELWKWIAVYYMCTLGEVMKAALPACLKLESQTKIALNRSVYNKLPDNFELDDIDRQIINNLHDKQVSMDDLAKKAGKKNILSNIKKLLDTGIVIVEEELVNNYKSKYQSFISLHPDIDSETKLGEALDSLKKARKQELLLRTYIEIANPLDFVHPLEISKNELLDKSGVSESVYKLCEEKAIFTLAKKRIDRLKNNVVTQKGLPELSPAQNEAFDKLKTAAKPVLLHGITSSGKTEIYIRLIDETLKENRQVLYLLPEIALTTQIIERLRVVFGNKVGIYHSNFSDAERTEVYNNLLKSNDKNGVEVILGVRSSLLLPFSNLGLIIVDEEHESTYKQYEPAPRYNARDAAIILGKIHGARVVLGSATPSLESYYNALLGKYELVKLTERYGKAILPEIRTIDMKRAYWKKKVVSNFSEPLLNAIKSALARNEQVILFQNRRGFSPFVQCDVCGHVAKCKYCDVSLTYHKYNNVLTCHYCGYSISMPSVCPACSSTNIKTKGFGTEKIEDELSFLIPEARIERLDLDATKSKYAYGKILHSFATHTVDILVGTQMITKGLDFGNVSLVGIMNADNLLNFPDFRAYERSFQLMSQVAGRAGRKDKPGKVIIQTSIPENPVIRQVIKHDYDSFFATQIDERRFFNYPPFCRLIVLSIKHSKQDVLREAGEILKIMLIKIFGKDVAGPEPPPIGRIQNKFILNFRIKLRKNSNLDNCKRLINNAFLSLKTEKKYTSVIIIADIDPM
ncbi:MAG: primosomal protein N' [Prevotellaceae bacterium]|jgi:primosomal protein N' (replication factor Y)|nr:primosomal protein N' [Prevotellaceae bacterium]